MSTLIAYVFSVTGVTLGLIAIAVLSAWRLGAGGLRRTMVAAAVVAALSTVAIVPYAVGCLLAWGYHPFTPVDVGGGPSAIILLGAGDVDITGRDSHITMPMPVEAAYILEARRVFGLLPESWIITSGGPAPDVIAGQPSSVVMREQLVRLGVPPERIVLESASHNTHEEAVLIAPMLRARGIQRVVLVTSPTHMRRALGTFRAAGWNTVPATATDPRRPRDRWQWVLPTDEGLDATSDVVHELVGIPYYWLRGWWRSS
jgi:uncharacterized SAM-binding protein YcdF (DUF218 family)